MLTDLLFRARSLLRRRRVEEELDEELRDHLEHEARKYMNAGLSPSAAARRARLAMGGLDGVKEQCRDARGTRPLEDFVTDLRYGLRLLTRSPGFAAAAIAMLGLGVGSATAIFGIVEGVLLRPLSYPNSERIVTMAEVDRDGRRHRVSLPDFRDWAAQAKSFEAIAAQRGDSTTAVARRQGHRIHAVRFHGDLLRVFGSATVHGRPITPDEIRSGATVAVVSQGFAERVADDARGAVGEAIEVSGTSLTIVGVLKPVEEQRSDVFAPANAFGPDVSGRTDYNWEVVARLQAGTELSAARSEMQTIAGRLRAESGSRTSAVAVSSLLDDTVRGIRPALLSLLAAGGLLILIACANVANLLLARGVGRRREIAIRQVMGAGRGRVVRQLVVESVPLVVLSAVAGLALAHWSFAGLVAMVPFSIPRRAEISVGASALMFGLLVSCAAGLLFAIAPALQTSTGHLTTKLNTASRTVSGRDGGLRKVLVAGQFALALALLSCAGLLTKSFVRLAQVESGFDHRRALVLETELPETAYPSAVEMNAFWRSAIEHVAALPGVESVGIAESAPLEGGEPNGTAQRLDERARGSAWYGVATAGFFEALDIPLSRGRLFDQRDAPAAPRVAVINQVAAHKFWPGQDPIGQQLRWRGKDGDDSSRESLTVIGVIGDIRHSALAVDPIAEIYGHFFQDPSSARDADLVLRTASPASLVGAVRSAFESLDPGVPVRLHTLESSYRESLAQPRFQAVLIGFFAVCALLLSAVGLYSSMAYAVSQQTREIGIRLALGGAPGTVRREVLGAAMRIAVVGAVVGTLLGAGGGSLIANQLFGVEPGDPGVFLAAASALSITALLAAYIPARRASRTNPIDALRYE
jgi:putative ABC transport system permease protein